MKGFLKFLGPILVLFGALVLVYYHFVAESNALLVTSLVLMLCGLVGHVIINRKVE